MKGRHAAVIIFIAAVTAWAPPAGGSPVHVRAREHFDTVRISSGAGVETYQGLGPTVNLWYERPYLFSAGLAAGMIFAWPLDGDGGSTGDFIRLGMLGVEAKFFPLPGNGLYARLGAFASRLYTKGDAGTADGTSGLLGLGWEFPFENLGVAVDAGFLYGRMEKGVTVMTSSPALGFHFYRAI